MRTLHLPHIRRPSLGRHASADHTPGAEDHHHHPPITKRLQRAEGLFDTIVIIGIVVLGAAMAYGLLTATGDSRWMP